MLGMSHSGEGEAFKLSRFHTPTEGSQAIVVPANLAYTRPEFPELNYYQWLRERIAGESLVCKKRRQHRVVAFQWGWHRRSGG
jgi:hypothetical protein